MSEQETPNDGPDAPAAGDAAPASELSSEPPTQATKAAADEAPTQTSAPATAPAAGEPPTETGPAAADQPPAERGTPAHPAGTITRGRLIMVDALIVFTTILAVVGILSIWANRLLFNPNNWANTSTQLLQNSDIRDATSNYVVDQLYKNVNVAGLVGSALPPRLDPLAGPISGGLRNVAVQGVNFALERPAVQQLWSQANKVADQSFIAVVEGGKGPVGIQKGVVTLDLAQIVDNAAARFGLPSDLGAKIPASVAHLTVFKSNQLGFVQTVGQAVKGLALWLTILVPLLYALAIFLARSHRRRTLMSVGFAIVIAGIVGLAGRSILVSAITNSLVSDAAMRPAVRATVGIGTEILAEIAAAFVLVGIVFVIAAWFAGPARLAEMGRRALAPFLRDRTAAVFGVVVAIMLVIFIWQPIPATGTPVGIVVFMLLALAGTEVLRRETAIEFPDAHEGDTGAALRARYESFREARHRHHDQRHEGQGQSVPEQLERLAALRDKGSISDEEYNAAKANLLHA